jgi:diguanylate cyclase (GGDEF)-like protein
LLEPDIGPWAALGGGLLAALGGWRLGLPGVAALLPSAALLPFAGWPAWSGWTAAALTGAVGGSLWLTAREELRVLPLRRELRDAERERADLDRQIRRFPLLLDACVALSAAREVDRFAAILVERARSVAPETVEVMVLLARPVGGECRVGIGADGAALAREPDNDERYVLAEARSLIRRQPGGVRVVAPLRAERRQAVGPGGGEAMRGVLSVRLAIGDDGGRVAVELLQALARLGGIALAAVELVEQARGLALRDELTGLLGRQEFLRRLDEQVAHARRARRLLAVVACDLDHLKRYNDTWGHPAGDAALRAVGAALAKALDRAGLACRWGGEEFCACAMVSDEEGMRRLGEVIRSIIEASTPDPAHPERRVTASVGVAIVRNDEPAQAALERADRACYRSKGAGRNRVTVAT